MPAFICTLNFAVIHNKLQIGLYIYIYNYSHSHKVANVYVSGGLRIVICQIIITGYRSQI